MSVQVDPPASTPEELPYRSYHEERDARDRQMLRGLVAGFILSGIMASGHRGPNPVGDAVHHVDKLFKELGL